MSLIAKEIRMKGQRSKGTLESFRSSEESRNYFQQDMIVSTSFHLVIVSTNLSSHDIHLLFS